MDLYELLEKRNPVEKEKESKSLVDQLIKRNEILSNENKALKKEIDTLKLCNSDYYNQINTLSSKIFRIKERLSYIETNPESLSDDIIDIIDDKEICLKHIENPTEEVIINV